MVKTQTHPQSETLPPAGESSVPSAANAENFSLKDFFQATGSSLMERVKPFSDYVRQTQSQGNALYAREVTGPAGPRVRVMDPLTGAEREMLMLGSNNYLGLANHAHVKARVLAAVEQLGTGMGGPPLLNGMSSLHRQLERKLAALKGTEDALLFASGYQANLGWVNGLLRDDDVLLYDELNHASLYDGIKLLSATCRVVAKRFRHNDTEHLRTLLERSRKAGSSSTRQIFVAVEGVYSMDGDLAPLPEIRRLCDQFGAILVVDDAHGTGVMGPKGGGTAEHFGLEGKVDIAMGTFSKSFGTTGGFVAGKQEVIDYLRFFARSYMFSAHLPPTTVAAVLGGLEVMETEPGLFSKLHFNAEYLASGLRALGLDVERSAAIIPVRIPTHLDIRALARRFHEEGVFLNSVEYPAVARDEQRLRISVMATHELPDLDEAIAVFRKLGQECGLIPEGGLRRT